jgi:hypothetical protein
MEGNLIIDFSSRNIITQLMSNPNATFPYDIRTNTPEFRQNLLELKIWLEGLHQQYENLNDAQQESFRQDYAQADHFPGFNTALFTRAILELQNGATQPTHHFAMGAGRRKSRRFKKNRRRKTRR